MNIIVNGNKIEPFRTEILIKKIELNKTENIEVFEKLEKPLPNSWFKMIIEKLFPKS